jgi:hypothetical protein
MPIDASLFAHIENDSSLQGLYKLQGNHFSKTVGYLNEYIEQLSRASKPFPPEYAALLSQMQYLVTTEQKLDSIQQSQQVSKDVNQLAQSIAERIMSASSDEKILLPGGWHNSSGGHAMVYEFVRQDDGFNFSAINSGSGLRYHAKKSRQDKELYNPKKTWHVPNPSSPKDQTELVHFIEQLLTARLPVSAQPQNKPINAEVLYKEILPNISYINGREIDVNSDTPDHAFTGGQLSGTCAQRCLHQMLKTMTREEKTYQEFIYDFKQSALIDYSNACMQGQQPYTPAVARQIRLAIKNNLKILNTPGLFNEIRIEKELEQFALLKKSLKETPFTSHLATPVIPKQTVPLSITNKLIQANYSQLYPPDHNKTNTPHIKLNDGKDLLVNLTEAIKNAKQISDKAAQYNYLEQLMLQLPLNLHFPSAHGFYHELKAIKDLELFKNRLDELQTLLLALQNNWIKEQSPGMNILLLSITSLQMDAYNAKMPISKMPDFTPFTDVVMNSLVGNQYRNPYYATNNPILDQRLKTLEDRYKKSPVNGEHDYCIYFKQILSTEPELNEELNTLYDQKYGHITSRLHQEIRKMDLKSLFMMRIVHSEEQTLAPKFNPIISKFTDHIKFESKMRRAINPFYKSAHQFSDNASFEINDWGSGQIYINTPLDPVFVPSGTLSTVLSENKYSIKDSPARDALVTDMPEKSVYRTPIKAKSANMIQLEPGKSAEHTPKTQHVTQADIAARDYLHLRSEPELQIALTLDYFTRHIEKLSDESNQRYVEANLFQPGLLIKALEDPAFLPQLDLFLKRGQRFFTHNGQHTPDSLLYLRLDFLVSRYLAQTPDHRGLERLKTMQNELEKQLSLPTDPDITYMLQHYLFLNLVTQMEQGEQSDELFNLAYKAYHYIQSHTNPLILEDSTHLLQVDCSIAKFKAIINKQSPLTLDRITKNLENEFDHNMPKELKYFANPLHPDPFYRFNTLQGKLFEGNLAHSGVPLAIQKHPLIKELGLHHTRECLMNVDGTYMILPWKDDGIHLFYENNNLAVRKNWMVNGNAIKCELQALTKDHQAQYATKQDVTINSKLPSLLTDGTMNYWRSIDARQGVLVQNNIPVYAVSDDKFWALDSEGNKTGAQLTHVNFPFLQSFEGNEFQLTHLMPSGDAFIKLPRYNLNFELNAGNLINQDTKEQLLDRPSPIHPAVAGLVMDNKGHQRYLVPIARFYGTEEGAQQSDFYPVVHDIEGTIAHSTLEDHWSENKPLQKPIWRYPNSEHYASFQLKDGEPIADTPADALYLTYIYLATNQTQKAWQTLEECNTRLGGLTGTPDELKYISWICKEMPHVLPNKNADDYTKETPPHVACRLKAMSLLCDHLSQNGPIPINTPKTSPDTANAVYESLCTQDLEQFQLSLPETIYQSFTLLQSMRRHLEHTYTLSPLERKQLLSYYHQTQPKDHAPQGALGFEWLSLSLEALQEERDALLARQTTDRSLSTADQERMHLIQARLEQLKPAVARSTALEQVSINLELPHYSTTLPMDDKLYLLPGESVGTAEKDAALDALSSKISDDDFIAHFPAYLQITQSNNKQQRTDLYDFCTKTLLAKRHVSLEHQKSKIPIMCNMLYRLLTTNEPSVFQHTSYKFSKLVSKLSDLDVRPLQVYQAKDVYHDILATPEQIMAQQERPIHTSLKATRSALPSLIAQTGIEQILNETAASSKTRIDELISEYKKSTNKCDEALTLLGQKLNNDLDNTFAIEEQAGAILFAMEQQKAALANALIKNPELTETLLKATASAESQIKAQREQAWSTALALANQGPEDPSRAKTWAIEKKAKARPMLTQSDLLSLYSRADFAYSVEKTGLSMVDVQRLHDLTHQALIHGIQHQSLEKITENLEKASATGNANIAAQALEVLSRTEIPGLDEPSVVILQHEEQILLRKRQVSALKSLLIKPEDGRRFNETIEKIIMGGGKSKVILPILAEKKAQGDNLVVVEVPQALLATNHVDLNQTSQRLFGKRAYRFEFNRDSDSSPERLEQMYHLFIEIMTTRGYLVTTGESVQSLELKYLELLMAKEEHDETWSKQIYWCDKITNLFRHHTDCIIDEVHQGLSMKKKLNYTSGEPKPISQSLIQNATALFGFIDLNIIKKAPSFDEHYDWTPFKTELATKLITEPSSPLSSFVNQAKNKYRTTFQAELIAYLLNQAETMPEAVLNADAETKAAFGFFKQEINVRLPQTLPQELYKKYGPSKRHNLSPVEQTLAIPYAGTHVPNERNRYQDELEAINKTCQMMMIEGLSKELLTERIAQWEALAREELLKLPADAVRNLTIDDTPTAQGFALLTSGSGLKLSQVNSKNSDQMTDLHQRLKFNMPLIFDCLRESSLKQIQQDSAILSSDNFNHADQYRSVQGISGTPPWNDAAYHRRLRYDKTSSLGTDGYIFELMRNKKSPVSGCDYENVAQFISTILSRSSARERTRAIIDIKGTFTDVNNLEVAKQIALYIKTNPDHFTNLIKQVLYFNEDQVLCALDVNNPAKSTIIGTSEASVLNRILDSTPEERFTLYDQIHTVGTDIKQYGEAHALVLVDDKTSRQDFLQGCMRERELELNQTNEIIVPQRMHGISLDALGAQFKNNDQQDVFADAPAAAQGQMKNHIRRQFLSLIQDIPSEEAEKKAALTQHFRPLFEDTPSLDLFALYGGINRKQAIKGILDHYIEQMKTLWETRLNAAKMAPHAQDIERMTNELQGIIERAIPFCLPEYEGLDNSVGAEIEVQKEVQKEVQIEILTLNETYNSQHKEQSIINWPIKINAAYYFKNHGEFGTYSSRLNIACAHDNKGLNLFTNNLYASKNFSSTYFGQTSSVDAFMKPVFLIWYHIHEGQLSATIVTPQEALELASSFKEQQDNWLSTTQDIIIAGHRPEGIMDNLKYQEAREQVRFFNGEFSSLLDQETPLLWLQEQPEEKINFYTNTLLHYRPGSESKLLQFEASLTQTKFEGFAYIAARPFKDLTHFNWLTLYPELIARQAAEYKKFAEVFVYLNQNWSKKEITLDELQQQFRLPLNSLIYIDKHRNHLMTLKRVLDDFEKMPAKTFLEFIDNLDLAEKDCLEQCIGMTIDQFYAQCECAPLYAFNFLSESEAQNISIHSIELLEILNTSPAFKDKNLFNKRFEDLAMNATSQDELLALIDIEKPTENLVFSIIHNNNFHDSFLMVRILNSPQPLSESNLYTLAKKCQNSGHSQCIDLLLRQPNISDEVLYQLLAKPFLNESQLIAIIKHAKKEKTITECSEHPSLSPQVITEILQHPLLPKSTLQRLLAEKQLSEEQLLIVLQHPFTSDPDLINNILEQNKIGDTIFSELLEHHIKNNSTLITIYKHSDASQETRKRVLNHPQLPADFALDIINNKPTDEELLLILNNQHTCNNNIRIAALNQCQLNAEHCKAILPYVDNAIDLVSLFIRFESHPDIRELVLNHHTLTAVTVQNLLRNHTFSNNELLLILNNKNANNRHIVQTILTKNNLSENILLLIIEKYCSDDLTLGESALEDQNINTQNLETLFNYPSASTTIKERVLQHPLVKEQFLSNLVNEPVSEHEISLILKHPKCNNTIRQAVLNKALLTEEHLMKILELDQSEQIVEQIYNHPAATPETHKRLLQHPSLPASYLLNNAALPDNEMLLLLQHPTAITNKLLENISKHPSIGNEVLIALITHEKADDHILSCAVNHRAFDLNAALIILKKGTIPEHVLLQLAHKIFELKDSSPLWEECIEQIIKQAKVENVSKEMRETLQKHITAISPESALKFLKPMGNDTKDNNDTNDENDENDANDALENIALDPLIQNPANEDLDKLINSKVQFSRAELIKLAKKNLNTKQIDRLLAHPSMSSTVANILFKKPAYSGEIKDWSWLTKEQFIDTLNRTKDFGSLKRAFDHLPKSTLQQWYDQKLAEHQEAIKLGIVSTKIENKLFCALEDLKLKSLSHCINAIDDPKYEQAAQSSFVLYQTLHTEANQFLTDPNANANATLFRKNCGKAIDNAKPVLEQHRGFKQMLLDIANVIFAVTALFRNGNWRLFEAKTSSMNTVNNVLKNMDELIENGNHNIIPPAG